MTAVNPENLTSSQPTRRERARAATSAEIVTTARALLVDGGPDAVTLRSIAARLGLTAPALYRYFDSRERLLGALVNAIYDELADELYAARDGSPAADLKERFMVTSFRFRAWALEHRPEFGLLFGAPIPGVPHVDERLGLDGDRGQRFGQVWLELFVELWQQNPVVIPQTEEIDPQLRDRLADYDERTGHLVPLGALVLYLSCWMQLYGAVATEAFGHLDFALGVGGDGGPLFHEVMRALAGQLGLRHD